MSTNRGMDKEAVIHIKNGLLLRHKKEHSFNEVDEPRAHYTELSKSEREKPIHNSKELDRTERLN